MRDRTEWAKIVREHLDLLNGFQLESLYDLIDPRDRNYLTRAIIECGVNPLNKLLRKIPEAMYYNILNITDVQIPSTIESIGLMSFADCKNLTNVIIPKNIKMIGYKAFYNCRNLKHIIFEGTMEQWHSAAANFDTNWNEKSLLKDIRCSDGTISLR